MPVLGALDVTSKNVTSHLPEAVFQVLFLQESVTTFRHTKAR